MSKHRHPAARFAEAIDLPSLAAFVQFRTLVLADDPEQLATLEKSGISQVDAMRYFLHVYKWDKDMQDFLTAPTYTPEQKEFAVQQALRETKKRQIITPRPEA